MVPDIVFRYYINYKLIKKRVKLYVQQTQVDGKDHQQVLKEFSRILDEQVQGILLPTLFTPRLKELSF